MISLNILTKSECGKVVYKVLKSNVEMFLAFFLLLILSFLIIGSEFSSTQNFFYTGCRIYFFLENFPLDFISI